MFLSRLQPLVVLWARTFRGLRAVPHAEAQQHGDDPKGLAPMKVALNDQNVHQEIQRDASHFCQNSS